MHVTYHDVSHVTHASLYTALHCRCSALRFSWKPVYSCSWTPSHPQQKISEDKCSHMEEEWTTLRLVDWLADSYSDSRIHWLTDTMTDWLIDLHVYWWINWSGNCCIACHSWFWLCLLSADWSYVITYLPYMLLPNTIGQYCALDYNEIVLSFFPSFLPLFEDDLSNCVKRW